MCDGRIDFYRCKETKMTKIKVKSLIERIIRYIFSRYRMLSEIYNFSNCNREIARKSARNM